MNKTSIIYFLLFGLFFISCKDFLLFDQEMSSDRELVVTAVMPGENIQETRISLHEKTGSLKVEARWQSSDKIQFFFKQSGEIYAADLVYISSIDHTGKEASFKITIPENINTEKSFDLYGFCGVEVKKVAVALLVDISPETSVFLEDVSAPVWCEIKNIKNNGTSLSLNFNHLAAYEFVHLQNNSNAPLRFSACALSPSNIESDLWYYISEEADNKYNNYYFNAASGNVVVTNETHSTYSMSDKVLIIPAGAIKTIVNRYFPKSINFPESHLKLLTSSQTEIVSAQTISSKKVPLQLKKVYHIYASWDGGKVNITDEDFNVKDEGNEIEFGSFTDSRDGNVYKTVQIGNQVWMAENLKYLPKVSNPVYGSVSEPYYHVYGYYGADVAAAKATQNYKTHGVLYNWPAAIEDACPDGWHLPSGAEWAELQNYLIKNGYNYDGSHSDNKVAIAMAKLGLWENHGGTGTVGNGKSYIEYQNKSGFSGIPSGFLHGDGRYLDIGFNVYFWTANAYTATNSFYHRLSYDEPYLYAMYRTKASGFSVRCMRN